MGMRGPAAVAVAVTTLGLTGCQTTPSSGAPPLVVCGQTLNSTPAGAVLTDATSAAHVQGRLTAPSAVFIRMVSGCDKGAHVSFDPAKDVTVIARATAADGNLVAVGVRASHAATAHITRADGTTSVVDLPAV